MQKVQKRNIKFFRSLFFNKIFRWASRNQYWLPRRKSFVQMPEICGWVFYTDEKTQSFPNFLFRSNVPVATWKWSIVYPAKSFMTKADFFFCQVSESHKKGCKFFWKKTLKWFYGQVEWSFDTTAGDKLVKRRRFFAPCPNVIKKTFVQKFFFSKKSFLWKHRMLFWQSGRFFWGNANRFCSISDADKTKRNRKFFFERR